MMKRHKKTSKQRFEVMAGKLWKKAIFLRWGDRCIVCGNKAGHPHHFVERSKSQRLKYEVDNGVPLCFVCHFKVHNNTHESGEVYRICEIIIAKRGLEWYNWIKAQRAIKQSSFYTVGFIKGQIEKLNEVLKTCLN